MIGCNWTECKPIYIEASDVGQRGAACLTLGFCSEVFPEMFQPDLLRL